MAAGRVAAPCFRRVYNEGRSTANRLLVLYYLPDDVELRLGVSAGKKLGTAVLRNKLRRRVKEAFRLLRPYLIKEGQIVFILRRGAIRASYWEILNAEKDLLKRMELLQDA